MNANPDPKAADLLDRFHDGLLTGEELEAFERQVASDPALRARVEELRRIDASLRRAFEPPPVRLPAAPVRGEWRLPISPRRLALAAVVLVAVVAALWYYQTALSGGGVRRLTPGDVYQRLSRGGFHPQFVCTTDEEFNQKVKERFGQGLLIASAPNIELIGWAYSSPSVGVVLSEREWILMARVDGRQTIVVMDRAENDRRVRPGDAPGMHMFKRRVGDMVLYELTPEPAPTLIDKAYVPGGE